MRFKVFPPIFLTVTMAFAPVATAQEASLQDRIAAAPDGSFEAGTYQTLAALEGLLQNFKRYGIGSEFGQFMGIRGRDLRDSGAEPREADTFSNILVEFLSDLETARAALRETTPATAKPFVVDVSGLWFDINGDGVRSEGEAATQVLGLALPRMRRADAIPDGPLDVRFDGADHAWLMAYTHVLAATANMVLAFDPTPVFEDLLTGQDLLANIPTIENTYDEDELRGRIASLNAEKDRLEADLAEIRERRKPLDERSHALMQEIRDTADEAEKSALQAERNDIVNRLRNDPEFDMGALSTSLRFLHQQIRAAEAKLPTDPNDPRAMMQAEQMAQFDEARNAVYALIKALEQQPDADRLARAEAHWRAMLEQNRLFWELVVLETDDDREWVPNPNQTSALGLTVDEELAEAWQMVLDDGEALLDGRLLITHALLPQGTGVSVARWLDDPSPLDIAGWIHGRSAYPYLAKGPAMTRESWLLLQRLSGGNGIGFSLFLN